MKRISASIAATFFSILLVAATAGVLASCSSKSSKLSDSDRRHIEKIVEDINAELPEEIGTVGSWDSITFSDPAICYHFSLKGSASIDTLYENHMEEVRKFLLYSFSIMNGQKGNGDALAFFGTEKGLEMKVFFTTPSSRVFSWTVSYAEAQAFTDSIKLSPAAALHDVIEWQIRLTNMELPIYYDIEGNIVDSSTNEETMVMTGFSHINNDIQINCLWPESWGSVSDMASVNDDPAALDVVAQGFGSDPDVILFINLLVISHSDLRLKYTGKESGDEAVIVIPYRILKKYSSMPQYILH